MPEPLDLDAILSGALGGAVDPTDRGAQGAVFLIKDDLVVFPAERADGAGARTLHDTRRVIQVQSRLLNENRRLKTTLIVPCSSSGNPAAHDYQIPQNEPLFTAPQVVAYATLVQPILKAELGEFLGVLRPETLGGLLKKVFGTVGVRPNPGG